jgi:hypothetical protein
MPGLSSLVKTKLLIEGIKALYTPLAEKSTEGKNEQATRVSYLDQGAGACIFGTGDHSFEPGGHSKLLDST